MAKRSLPGTIRISEDSLVLPERATTMAFVSSNKDSAWTISLQGAPDWVTVERVHPRVARVLAQAPSKSRGLYPFKLILVFDGKSYINDMYVHVEPFRGHAYTLDGPKWWKEAVKRAEAGDMIRLMDGDYGDLHISGKKTFSLLISQASGFNPKVRSLTIENSTNIAVFGLDIGDDGSEIPQETPLVSVDAHSGTIAIEHCMIGSKASSHGIGIASKANKTFVFNNFIQHQKYPIQLTGKNNEIHDNIIVEKNP